jgi:endonuclease YncB( thermonuclease family)
MLPLLLVLASTIVPNGQAFTCTPTRVWDGDGPIWCAEGPRIRLAGIAAREMGETCRRGHPCPKATGRAARDHLVQLLGGSRGTMSTGHIKVRGPAMRCVSLGSGKGSRTAAWCAAPGPVGDLSCRMVRDGYAAAWKSYGGDQVCGEQRASRFDASVAGGRLTHG